MVGKFSSELIIMVWLSDSISFLCKSRWMDRTWIFSKGGWNELGGFIQFGSINSQKMEVWMWIYISEKMVVTFGCFWLGPQTDVNLDKDSETWRSGKYFVCKNWEKPKKGKGLFFHWAEFLHFQNPKSKRYFCIFKT